MDLNQKLKQTLLQAIHACYVDVPVLTQLEEHGGWILKKDDEYKFFFLRNSNTGTVRAQMLFSADSKDVANGPLKAMMREGWTNYGTFHTHPQFSITPSSIDWNLLFQNSKHNFIYSPATEQLGCSVRDGGDDENQEWVNHVWDVVSGDFVKVATVKRVQHVDTKKIHDDDGMAVT